MTTLPDGDIDPGVDLLVVGAGISGLTAARGALALGLRVRVLEKSRGVGGRMATRRLGSVPFDHGAQFFTVRDPVFASVVDGWLEDGLVGVWSRGFPDAGCGGNATDDGHPRYQAFGGMTAPAKRLREGLDVVCESRVGEVRTCEGGGWDVVLDDGRRFRSSRLLLTPPVPQALALLDAGDVPVAAPVRQALDSIAYDRCLTLMVMTDRPSRLPRPGALRNPADTVEWMADNRRKGWASVPDFSGAAVTLHATPAFSEARWDMDPAVVTELLVDAVREWIPGTILEARLHRWRYSRPRQCHPERCVRIPGVPPLVLAGDAFGGPRVEGALLSGRAALEQILEPE